MGIESLLASLRAGVTQVTHVHASNGAGSGVTSGDFGDVTGVTINSVEDTEEPGPGIAGNLASTYPSDGLVAGNPLPDDDRIHCPTCDHYTPPGCRACRQGRFSFRSRDHHPDPGRPHRCLLFTPLADDPDQRPGAARWPDLAWQGRAPR